MSRLTNDIDAINQAVSQNVTALIASVLSLVGILVPMFVLNFWLALASVLVVPIMFGFTSFVARYTRRGFRRLAEALGAAQRHDGRDYQRAAGGQGLSAQRYGDRGLSRSTIRRSIKAGLYANTYALLLMPLTNVLGNLFVIVLAGLGGWLALQRAGNGGHDRHLYQLRPAFHPAAAPAGQYVQRHPGCPGRRRAGFRDPRHPARIGGRARCRLA